MVFINISCAAVRLVVVRAGTVTVEAMKVGDSDMG
jgi:hypothetical protein